MKLDDVLSDACGLLDEIGTCEGNCKDFNETKKLLEKACDIEEKRTDPSEWMTLGDISVRKPSKDDWKLVLFGALIFIPMALLFTFIHESGHWIASSYFGWDVIDFHVSLFPFVLESLGGYVLLIIPPSAVEWQVVLVYGAGSLFTLIIAYVLFFLFYKFKLNKYVELVLVAYMAVFGLDSIIYVIGDLFFGGTGDWSVAYSLSPPFVFVILSLCITNVVLFVSNFGKIARNVDIE